MKSMKRFLALLLAMAMILTNVPLEAYAEESTDGSTTDSSADVNLALNKDAVATNAAEYPASKAVDGDLSTRWSTWVQAETYGAPQSLTVDLETTSTIRKFVIYNEESGTQKIRKFKVEGSNNGTDFSVIYESEDNTAGYDAQYEVSLNESCEYRFVKFTVEQLIDNAVNCVSLREFQVWGTPGKTVYYEYEQFNPTTTTPGYTYLLEENAIANTWSTSGNDGPAAYAFNGVSSNWWHTKWDSTDISSVTGNANFSPTYEAVDTIPAFSEVKNVRAWIGSSFGESITLGRFTYKGRTDSGNVNNNWINQYAFYVANVTGGEPADTDWQLVASGNFGTNTENVVTLENPVQATHFRLVAFTRTYTDFVTASEIKIYEATEVSVQEGVSYTNEEFDSEVLKTNAETNTWSETGNDGPAAYAFDGVAAHHWHSNYSGGGGGVTSGTSVTWGEVNGFPAFKELKSTRAWIGSSFGETIQLSKITYKGRSDNANNWITQYALYVANVAEGAQVQDSDWQFVTGGKWGGTATEKVIELSAPVEATHFRLVAFTATNSNFATASEIKVYQGIENLVEDLDLLKAGSIPASDETITNKQPFAAGTAGSNIFRIPCLITLDDGNLLAAADARYTEYRDFGGIDTIASVSTDNGETWNYSFPIYFPDSAGSTGTGQSTTAIDPAIVQAANGKIYCMADMNPTGVTTLDTYPLAGTGFVTINGKAHLALTSNYSNASTLPTDADTTTYDYYVGDFQDGYAPVLKRADNTASEYIVDEWYNIYNARNKRPLVQTQVNSETEIQQNAFYRDSVLHVYNTGYIWIVESNDGGMSWENPRILNPQLKRDNEAALLVSPGKGLVTSEGDIIIGCYNNLNSEDASFFYSTDDGATWHRTTGDVPNTGKESENEMIQLADGTIRMFYRSNTTRICYSDITKSEDGTYSFGEQKQIMDFQVNSNCNVSALYLEDVKIDEKPVILVSLPDNAKVAGTFDRRDGRIYVFTVNADNTMNHEFSYEVNSGQFAYSCMTVLENGNIGMLWEPGTEQASAIRYDEFPISKIIGTEKDITLIVGESYTEEVAAGAELKTQPENKIADAKFESQLSWSEHQLYDHSGSWNNANITASDLAAFNSVPNKELSLQNAEFTFTGADNSWVIQNEATGKYLRQEKANGVPAFLKDTETTMIVQKVEGDDTFYIYQLQSDNTYRSIIFYYTQMNFNANSGEPNPDYSTSSGDYKLSLLEKQDSVSSDDILPGYKVAESITSGNKYLVSYIWERTTDTGAIERTIFVLYPGTDGTYNVTKLVNDSYVMYNHNSSGATFESTENRSINLKTAEYRFEGTVDDNGNFDGTIKTNAGTRYLTNKDGAGTFFTTDAYNMTLTKKTDGTYGFKLTEHARYILFHTDNTFNGQGGATNSTFVLLEKQDTVSETDILPGYAKVTDIQSGHDYLISYIDNAGNVYVLYPDNGTADQTKLVEAENPFAKRFVITGVAPGKTTAEVDGITYNITVVMDPDDASRDIPVEHLTATAGSSHNSTTEGGPNLALDNDLNTMWHTAHGSATPEENRWIKFEINGDYTVDGLRYLPRENAGNGTITEYVIEVSNDDTHWETVATGNWDATNTYKLASFDGKNVKYVRLKAVTSVGSFVSAREIRLTGVANEIDVTLKDIVVDFGLPVEYTFQSNAEITTGVATYGTVTVESEANGDLYNNTITYTLSSVLKGTDVITLTDSNDEEFTMNVYPATTVYYEEGFAEYDTTKAWTSTGAKGTDAQALQNLEEDSTGHYGYDSEYAAEATGPSNSTEAVSNAADNNTAGQKATFTFAGTGVDVYANCGADTGSAAIVISSTDEGSTYKKLMIVNTAMAGEGEGTASAGHNGINAYNIPIVSVNDLEHGNYEVAITHVKTSYTDETTDDLVQEAKPIKLDGFRVYNTMEDSSVFEVHNEADPNFVEMRNVVLNAIGVDVSDGDYAEDIAADLTQILDENETIESTSAIILDNGAEKADAQDRLDNGPKNELFLYPGQTLVFNLAAGLENVQIGMKAVNANVDVKVQKETHYLLGATDSAAQITSSTDMFYVIGDITEETTITIINNGTTGILSITDLKYFVGAEATQVFGVIEEEDLVPVLNSMGFISKLLNPFKDIIEGSYFFDAVLWAVKNKITEGWTETEFAPDLTCTRGQVVTFLWRAAGMPEVDASEIPFTDVAADAYYEKAVAWAVENGITDGWTDTTFAPDMQCTRGQIVTFIWRAAGMPEVEVSENPFKDIAENAYYYDAVLWAVENGITEGWLPTEFAPEMECARAQIVTFLYRAK